MSTREPLPNRRYSESVEIRFLGISYAMQIGFHDDGRIGDIFLGMEKAAGSQMDVTSRDAAVVISMAMQHGVPLDRMLSAVTKDESGRPEGLIGHVLQMLSTWAPVSPQPQAVSAIEERRGNAQFAIDADISRSMGFTGDQCSSCGSMKMKVSGHCMVCTDCGTTTGCS